MNELQKQLLLLMSNGNGTVDLVAKLLSIFAGSIPVLFDYSDGTGTTVTNKGEGGATNNMTLSGGVTWVTAPVGSNLLGGIRIDGLTGQGAFALPAISGDYEVVIAYNASSSGETAAGRFYTFIIDRHQFTSVGNPNTVRAIADYATIDAQTVGGSGKNIIGANAINYVELDNTARTVTMRYSNNGGVVTPYTDAAPTIGIGARVPLSGTGYVGGSGSGTQTFAGDIFLTMLISRKMTASERTQVRNLISF